MGGMTDLPVPELCFESVPVPWSPSCVDDRPVHKRDQMAVDLEDRVPVPVHTGVIPHTVQAGDVVRKSGCGWRRDIPRSERDSEAITKPEGSCLVTHRTLGVVRG